MLSWVRISQVDGMAVVALVAQTFPIFRPQPEGRTFQIPFRLELREISTGVLLSTGVEHMRKEQLLRLMMMRYSQELSIR